MSIAPRKAKSGLGRAIRQLREERDLSQEALAVGAGVTASSLGQIERGNASPRWDTVKLIATELGVSISELARLAEKLEG